MPELRSGARQARLKSKKAEDNSTKPQLFDQAENLGFPTPNRTGRRSVGRGRGSNAAAVVKGPVIGGRGKGVRLIDLDPDQPCEVFPRGGVVGGVVIGGGAQELVLNQAAEGVAEKDLGMEGGSASFLNYSCNPSLHSLFIFTYLEWVGSCGGCDE